MYIIASSWWIWIEGFSTKFPLNTVFLSFCHLSLICPSSTPEIKIIKAAIPTSAKADTPPVIFCNSKLLTFFITHPFQITSNILNKLIRLSLKVSSTISPSFKDAFVLSNTKLYLSSLSINISLLTSTIEKLAFLSSI